jgi:hypothetical protein
MYCPYNAADRAEIDVSDITGAHYFLSNICLELQKQQPAGAPSSGLGMRADKMKELVAQAVGTGDADGVSTAATRGATAARAVGGGIEGGGGAADTAGAAPLTSLAVPDNAAATALRKKIATEGGHDEFMSPEQFRDKHLLLYIVTYDQEKKIFVCSCPRFSAIPRCRHTVAVDLLGYKGLTSFKQVLEQVPAANIVASKPVRARKRKGMKPVAMASIAVRALSTGQRVVQWFRFAQTLANNLEEYVWRPVFGSVEAVESTGGRVAYDDDDVEVHRQHSVQELEVSSSSACTTAVVARALIFSSSYPPLL